MRGPLALIGILVVFAGIHLLWQSRREISSWLAISFKALRASSRQTQREMRQPATSPISLGREHLVRLSLGLSLVLVVGPVLIFFGLLT